MLSAKAAAFRRINRSKARTVVLIPGWATDYRIFDLLDINFNYILPIDFSPLHFEENLLDFLEENSINKISLFGWSLGGFAAAKFASRHKEMIDELILTGIREGYSDEEIAETKDRLNKNKKGRLYKFYSQSFYKKEQMGRFKGLIREYCSDMDRDHLFEGLDYFKEVKIDPESLKDIEKIEIIHGAYDKIAPIEEARNLKEALPQAEFTVIEDAGHIWW
ncbi:MAG: alpha/beta hydrolase [Candidatus Omnitrophica bacterium]|nr:alpha/beta hydrolase [Candidatus Omnitrophota bacterium]